MNVTLNANDRERAKIRAFWQKIELALRAYARFSAVRVLHLTNHEGFYLVSATAALLAMVAIGAWPDLPNSCSYLIALVAVYYLVDSLLMNTTTTFITQQPIHRLRSVILTLLNVLNVGIAYAVIYASQRQSFSPPLTAVRSIYFSFVTLTTLGYGDIKPDSWASETTVVLELATGLYLLAGVLSVVVSWTKGTNDPNGAITPDRVVESHSMNVTRGLVRLTVVMVGLWWTAICVGLIIHRTSAARESAAALRALMDKQNQRAPLTDWIFLDQNIHLGAGHALDESGYPAPDVIASKTDSRQRRKYVNFSIYPGLNSLGGLQFPVDTPDEEITRLLPQKLPQQNPTARDLQAVQEEISLGNRAATGAAYARATAESSLFWQALHLFAPSRLGTESILLFFAPLILLAVLAILSGVALWVIRGFTGPK